MTTPPYDQSFRASALHKLAAAGYPGQRGALIGVSRALDVPVSTLRRWARAAAIPPLPSRGEGAAPVGTDRELQLRICGHSHQPGTAVQNPGPLGLGVREPDPSPLPDAIRGELLATLRSMAAARSDATYKELTAGFAVLVDRLAVLTGQPAEAPDSDPGEARQRLENLLDQASNAADVSPLPFRGEGPGVRDS